MLIPVAEELSLPIAMKLGAHRGVNPSLRTGGVRAVCGVYMCVWLVMYGGCFVYAHASNAYQQPSK